MSDTTTPTRQTPGSQSQPIDEVVTAYKGFDRDLICNPAGKPFQYEIGKTYTTDAEVVRCKVGGFHSCEYPLDVFCYYPPGLSRFAVVKASGKIARDGADTKIASASIAIEAEIGIPVLVSRAIEWVAKRCSPTNAQHATGNQAASSATGYQAASSATGYRAASSATGDQAASSATGNQAASLTTGRYSSSEIKPADAEQTAVAIATGENSRARAPLGCAIVLVNRNADTGLIRHIRASKVDENGINPDTWYRLDEHGEFVEAMDAS